MPRSRLASNALLVVALGVAALLVARFVRDHLGCIYDDAFIYLRYVRNLRSGCGLRFNCEEAPVEGFTGPLYLALLWVGSFFSRNLVPVLEAESALLLGLTIGVTALVTFERSDRDHATRTLVTIGVLAVLAGDHLVLLYGVVGLETPLAGLLVVLLLRSLSRREPVATAALALAASLARPECTLFVLALPLLPWMRRWRPMAVAFGGLAVAELARWLLFHDVAPNTYWCKSGGTWRHAELGAAYLAECVRDFPVLALAPLALVNRERRVETGVFLGVVLAWLLYFLRSGGDFLFFGRLVFPLVPACTVLAADGLVAIARAKLGPILGRVAPIACFLGVMTNALLHRIPVEHGFENVRVWSALGHGLRVKYPQARLATVPIGAIGFYSHAPLLDLVGLTSRAIAKAGLTAPASGMQRGWIGHERHSLAVVEDDRPDLIVLSLWQTKPFSTLDEVTPTLHVEREIVDAIRAGVLPYEVRDLELEPGVHFVLLARRGLAPPSA